MRSTAKQPGRVWLVLGDKRGDNGQIDILVEALGWRCERKHLEMRPPYNVAKPRYRAALDHIDLARSSPLVPPWPDLILTVGRRPSMAALWIREQCPAHTRVVLLGKPSGLLQRFDLVVVSAEVQIPGYHNVMKIGLPLMRVGVEEVRSAADTWRPRFTSHPRPLVAFLVGGPTHPFVFNDSVVTRLTRAAEQVAGEGGTPYFTTSRRTPAQMVEALRRRLPAEAALFAWEPGAVDNPYHALLGLADSFVVTGDSLSMMVEVARLGKPLALFPLPPGWWGLVDQRRRSLARWLFAPPGTGWGERARAGLGRALHGASLFGHTRDFTAIHRFLVEEGIATYVDGGVVPPRTPAMPAPDDLDAVVARVRGLLAAEDAAGAALAPAPVSAEAP